MGEIGFSREAFLHDLKWWEVRSIIRGYNRRNRGMWSAVRWQTYNLMCVSMADISKAGIRSPIDLIQFPWEKESALPTKDEIEQMQAEMAAWNEARQNQKSDS